MNCYLITEGETDRALIEFILATEVQGGHLRLVAAGGQSAAISLARTLLVTRSAKVGVLIDADATSPALVERIRDEQLDALRAVSAPDRCAVFLAVPEIEAVLFFDIEALQEAIGRTLSIEDRTLARFQPKEVLRRLLPPAADPQRYTAALLTIVGAIGKDRFREHPLIAEIVAFASPAVASTLG